MSEITIILNDLRPVSWNVLKRMHRGAWASEVETAKMLVLSELRQMYNGDQPPIFSHIVDISIVCYFGKRPYDSSNIPLKLYEDGLIGLLIKDDSIKYVRKTCTEARIDRKKPRLEITITEVAQ